MAQRYKFESKSQQRPDGHHGIHRCFQWLKGTNLKANHNRWRLFYRRGLAVSNGSKVQIWKQITTWLLYPYALKCCFQWLKGTNLKANHNTSTTICVVPLAVSNGSKVQIWKQITTNGKKTCLPLSLFPMAQRYKFESKSQRRNGKKLPKLGCFQWLKGTNLKANHNTYVTIRLGILLFPMAQRYKFESKSQLSFPYLIFEFGCFQWLKGTNLKANHNRYSASRL